MHYSFVAHKACLSLLVQCTHCVPFSMLKTFCAPIIEASCVSFLLQDGNGHIDEQELDALLKDLCDKNKMVMNSEPIDLSVQVTFLIAKDRTEMG